METEQEWIENLESYPKLIFVGALPAPTNIFIGAEKTKLMDISSAIQGISSLLVLFYILNL